MWADFLNVFLNMILALFVIRQIQAYIPKDSAGAKALAYIVH